MSIILDGLQMKAKEKLVLAAQMKTFPLILQLQPLQKDI
jgi:hypothetical protein